MYISIIDLMFFLGFLGNYLYYVFLYGALEKTTASEGFILAYTWPMLVLVLSFIFLKNKVTLQKLIGILFSFFGIIIITTKGETHIVSNLVYLTPFISLIYISIFLGEKILISAVAGGVVIVFGVLSQYIKINKLIEV